MQEWYFISSHWVEEVSVSLELFMINYPSKEYMKENTSLNFTVNLLVKFVFSNKVYRYLK
jgi:hypothetical protein